MYLWRIAGAQSASSDECCKAYSSTAHVLFNAGLLRIRLPTNPSVTGLQDLGLEPPPAICSDSKPVP